MYSIILVIALSLTDFVSCLLNAVVIFTFCRLRSRLIAKDMYLIGMAISDVLQCVLGYPLEIFSSQQGSWTLSHCYCKVGYHARHYTILSLDKIDHL